MTTQQKGFLLVMLLALASQSAPALAETPSSMPGQPEPPPLSVEPASLLPTVSPSRDQLLPPSDSVVLGRRPLIEVIVPPGLPGLGAELPQAISVALLLEASPAFSDEQVGAALEAGAVDIGPKGKDPASSHGRLSACKALRAAAKKDLCARD